MDLIGSWKITVAAQAIEFRALTCVDIVTNLPEFHVSIIKNQNILQLNLKMIG